MDDEQEEQQVQQKYVNIRYNEIFTVAPPAALSARDPRGDKILLPPSALETLLNAASLARQQEQRAHYQQSVGRMGFGSLDGFRSFGYSNGGGELADFDLPQPLTFQLTNAATGKSVYAGIREFSADEGEIVLSPYLRAALGLEDVKGAADTDKSTTTTTTLSVSFHYLPKGTFVHLRPLAAGYNPADWRPLLERQLREGYTTLTKGAVFTVRGSTAAETFRFRVDGFKPDGDGICVVDTDLEVDIEALDEEQARETMRQIGGGAGKGKEQVVVVANGGVDDGSSPGGPIDIWKPVHGQVRTGDYVDYELPSWDRSRPLEIFLSDLDGNNGKDAEDEDAGYAVDLLVSPRSTRQRALPRETEHVWANFDVADANGTKKIVLQPTNVELETAEALLISVHGWKPHSGASDRPPIIPHKYTLRARIVLEDDGSKSKTGQTATGTHGPDEEQCKNCFQWVPSRTMVLHENFCLRNNVACPHCKRVFQKRSAAWQQHWHCDVDGGADGAHGDTAASKAKHDTIFHPEEPYVCPSDTCAGRIPGFPSLPALAHHRTTTCPAKLILCQFCQLEVPQEGDPTDPSVDAATVLTGQTPHERADGARTTECYLCGAIVRMRDMRAHLQHHDLDRQNRIPPDVCRDALCGRTQLGVGPRGEIKTAAQSHTVGEGDTLGLCRTCFAPLYVSTHDPEGKALRRRVERRYLAQLLTGCKKPWCANPWCRTGRENQKMEPLGGGSTGTAALLPLVKPLVAEMGDRSKPMHFCVDEESQKRRAVAELLVAQGGGLYALPWCVAACEAEGADAGKAWEWLSNWAPRQQPQTDAGHR